MASHSADKAIWSGTIGSGLEAGTRSLSLDVGAGYGVKILGTRQGHNLALTSLSYGYIPGALRGKGHWYQGNWELRGELWDGVQFSPRREWLVGLAPHLRYDFATGTRWMPYADAGAGVSATTIGAPDLSHTFEFNLQAAVGLRWFVGEHIAVGLEVRYIHLSCAGLSTPNLGLNNVAGLCGVTRYF